MSVQVLPDLHLSPISLILLRRNVRPAVNFPDLFLQPDQGSALPCRGLSILDSILQQALPRLRLEEAASPEIRLDKCLLSMGLNMDPGSYKK